MKLRDLFDKLTPGLLDTEVLVQHELTDEGRVKGIQLLNLKRVEYQDDGSVTLVVE